MTALIDADSLVYIVAWHHRDNQNEELVRISCDSIFHQILDVTQATHYFASFSAATNFRYTAYKYAPYKAGRPEKSENMQRWEKYIKDYYTNTYKFYTPGSLEADDIICIVAEYLKTDYIICSPDKDLRQIRGVHFDYRKLEKADEIAFVNVTEDQASYNFWMQMLTGDGTDNIKGVPGLGDVKAKLLLKEATDDLDRMTVVQAAYAKYFGHYYGSEIYQQTLVTVQLMSYTHPLWKEQMPIVLSLAAMILPKPIRQTSFDKELRELGWLDSV